MACIQSPQSIQPHVIAVFPDGTDSFSLAQGATFQELADRIDSLGARHEGAAVEIQVHFANGLSRQLSAEPRPMPIGLFQMAGPRSENQGVK